MTTAPWRSALADYIRSEAKPIEKYGHQPRLYSLTQQVGEGLNYDDDVVYAAAWLHDLGVFAGHRPEDPEELAHWDSAAYACEKAPAVLSRTAFPADKIQAVIETIQTHQPHTDPVQIEGIVLRDADILEQLGAIGILRAVCKIGRDTRFSTFSDVVPVLAKALHKLPSELRLDTSRKLAKDKIETLRVFLNAVEREAQDELF